MRSTLGQSLAGLPLLASLTASLAAAPSPPAVQWRSAGRCSSLSSPGCEQGQAAWLAHAHRRGDRSCWRAGPAGPRGRAPRARSAAPGHAPSLALSLPTERGGRCLALVLCIASFPSWPAVQLRLLMSCGARTLHLSACAALVPCAMAALEIRPHALHCQAYRPVPCVCTSSCSEVTSLCNGPFPHCPPHFFLCGIQEVHCVSVLSDCCPLLQPSVLPCRTRMFSQIRPPSAPCSRLLSNGQPSHSPLLARPALV